MQYITRAEASQKFDISLVTLDKYLKLWRIYTTRRKGKIMIPYESLQEYITLKNNIWWPFENKTLFEDHEEIQQNATIGNREKNSERNSVEQQEVEQSWTNKETKDGQFDKKDLAIIGGYTQLINAKDLIIEEKTQAIHKKDIAIRHWSNWFFIVLVLFICCALFALFLFFQ